MMPLFSGRSKDGTCVIDPYPKDNDLCFIYSFHNFFFEDENIVFPIK